MGHFLWPRVWIGPIPSWATRPGLAAVPAEMAEVMVDAHLPDGIRMRAFRDGILTFDFGSWGEPPNGADPNQFNELAEHRVRCVRLMNAHLACLHTATHLGPVRVVA